MDAKDPMLVWEAFYIIVGSSAGALTGLQFVVMALVADSHTRTSIREVDAFGTPTIVHFCAVGTLSRTTSRSTRPAGSATVSARAASKLR